MTPREHIQAAIDALLENQRTPQRSNAVKLLCDAKQWLDVDETLHNDKPPILEAGE